MVKDGIAAIISLLCTVHGVIGDQHVTVAPSTEVELRVEEVKTSLQAEAKFVLLHAMRYRRGAAV